MMWESKEKTAMITYEEVEYTFKYFKPRHSPEATAPESPVAVQLLPKPILFPPLSHLVFNLNSEVSH
jgi:hypothetical protein